MKRSPMVRQSHDELREQLKEQKEFLRSSNAAFDRGNASEAKRIATAIYIIAFDGGRNSVSLLSQLGLKDRARFFDSTAGRLPMPGNFLCECTLIAGLVTGEQGAAYRPQLYFDGMLRSPTVDFDSWWNHPVAKDPSTDSPLFTRGDLVLAARLKDGGAHVDGSQPDWYVKLAKSNFLGWRSTRDGVPADDFEGSAAMVALRQIGGELHSSLQFEPVGQVTPMKVPACRPHTPDAM